MCCFLASLALVGPRLAMIIYLLFPYGQIQASRAFHTFIWPLLGFVFLPWTTLMYLVFYTSGAWLWFFVVLGVAADIASYSAAAYRRRDFTYYAGP
jgi:hypothetical protein